MSIVELNLKREIAELHQVIGRLKQRIDEKDKGFSLKLFDFGSNKSYFQCTKKTKRSNVAKMKVALSQLNTNFVGKGKLRL